MEQDQSVKCRSEVYDKEGYKDLLWSAEVAQRRCRCLRMLKIVLLSMVLSGLQALPISRGLTPSRIEDIVPVSRHHRGPTPWRTEDSEMVADTEASRRFILDLSSGKVLDYLGKMDRTGPLGHGHGEMDRRHLLTQNVEDAPVQFSGGGWVRVESAIPHGFRQGTEPSDPDSDRDISYTLPHGFRQGTEPSDPDSDRDISYTLPHGFRQGTEPSDPDSDRDISYTLPHGFRQGTEPSDPDSDRDISYTLPHDRAPNHQTQTLTETLATLSPHGFRQGTEPSDPDSDRNISYTLPHGFRQGTEPSDPDSDRDISYTLPHGFRQGTEPSDPDSDRDISYTLPHGFRQGTEPSDPDSDRNISYTLPHGFRQGTEPSDPDSDRDISYTLPHGFRQGTEPSDPDSDRDISYTLPHGFRQGTEPSDPDSDRDISYTLPHGFRQGTEPSDPDSDRDISYTLPHGFRQGTEPSDLDSDRDISYTLPHGFRQGTEPSDPDSDRDISYTLPHGFRQGTEPSDPDSYREISYTLPHGFRQGTEPSDPDSDRNEGEAMSFSAEHVGTFQEDLEPSNLIMSGFRPDMEPLMVGFERSNQFPVDLRKECVGEVIYGRCYTFNPTPLPFLEAQDSCRRLNPNAELASVTNEDLHSRLVSMVTNGGRKEPVITWLGGVVKGQGQWLWLDGSEWSYSAWTPGQTNTNRAVCVEMFRTGESWTAADCDLSRASICSSPAAASTLHL
uniref:C-type lectin domain-containing protein n=1 Tax=Knipowitschia caucasica TaxID=637954 RepID=A0AAV2LEP0_KNICA